MLKSAGPAFPLEIVGHIIDILACDDVGTPIAVDHNAKALRIDPVLACSLTCKSLLPFCRRHLFKSIYIDISKFDFIHQLFDRAPHDAIYVRHIYFNRGVLSERPMTEECQEKILQVINRFTRVEELDYDENIGASRYRNWSTDIPLGEKEIFTRLIQLPTLTSLGLMGVSTQNIPSYVFVNISRRLRELVLQDGEFTISDDAEDNGLAPETPVEIMPGSIHLVVAQIGENRRKTIRTSGTMSLSQLGDK